VKLLFTFETINAALDGEGLFKALEIPCRIIPVPRRLSSACTYAITAETEDFSGLCGLLRQKGADYAKVFRCDLVPGKGETYTFLSE
jgi:hypothetical protein